MSTSLWTIGHGSRKIDDFISLLEENRIQLLVDVRRFPTSKTEHFRRERLEELLGSRGIGYVWLGDRLGGFRKEGYENYMLTKEFSQGIEELIKLASEKRTCIMCLEVSPKGCHRRFISMYLSRNGWDVFHIIKLKVVRRSDIFTGR